MSLDVCFPSARPLFARTLTGEKSALIAIKFCYREKSRSTWAYHHQRDNGPSLDRSRSNGNLLIKRSAFATHTKNSAFNDIRRYPFTHCATRAWEKF